MSLENLDDALAVAKLIASTVRQVLNKRMHLGKQLGFHCRYGTEVLKNLQSGSPGGG
jgi:hypothetical protein